MIVQDIRIFILHVIDLHLFEYKWLRFQYQNKYIFNLLITINVRFSKGVVSYCTCLATSYSNIKYLIDLVVFKDIY